MEKVALEPFGILDAGFICGVRLEKSQNEHKTYFRSHTAKEEPLRPQSSREVHSLKLCDQIQSSARRFH
jgi:hypothetical protein